MPPKQKRKGLPNKFYWADLFFPSFFKISGSQLLCFFAFQLFCFSLFLCFSTFPSWFASLFFYFSAFSCFSASLLIYFSASLISAFIGLCACRIFWQCLSLCKILPPMANGIAIFGSKCKILRERERDYSKRGFRPDRRHATVPGCGGNVDGYPRRFKQRVPWQ